MPDVIAKPEQGTEAGMSWDRLQEAIQAYHEVPDHAAVRKTFVEGVTTVQELERDGKIGGDVALELIRIFSVLYTNALMTRFSREVFGRTEPAMPDFATWWLRSR